MKKGLWIIIGPALLAATMGACAQPEGPGNTATVVEAINKVDAHPHPEDNWQPAAVEMIIYAGGQVRTASESSARLDLLEGIVRLWAETVFTVKECTTREGRLATTLFLQEGRLWAHLTTDRPHEFSVETASAVAAVRDTHFSVKAGSDQATFVSVAEGKVVLTAQGESVTVGAGQQAIVKPGQPPSPPEPMSDEERALWASEGDMPEMAPPTPTPAPTPTPQPTPTPTRENIVEQINRTIKEKGYDWEAGKTSVAGLTPEEMQKHYQELTELVEQASSPRKLTSPEEMKQSLDEGGLLAGEMIVYQDFAYYKGGIYRHAWGDQIGSHAVEIEGYDDSEGCWRARNSWGYSWGDHEFFKILYGEAGIEDNVYEIVSATTPTPVPTPTATPAPIPPTATPTQTPTPGPTAREYVEACNAYLEPGKSLLAAHENGSCAEGIRLLRLAIESSSTALALEPNNPDACYCRGMSRRWLEEELSGAVADLECALAGLQGDQLAEAERELATLRERLAAPICVSMGPPMFAEGWYWDEGEPINPGTEFPANSTREVWARWDLINPCNEVGVVKWYHDGLHKCQHYTDPLTGSYDGSGWVADEEWIEVGQWCVAVSIGDTMMTEGCFSVAE